LPAVIYNSPYYGFATRADLFFELRREYPNLIGFKEFGGARRLCATPLKTSPPRTTT
jgi:dihydrodipicolinate synthase/N-acetylneuraminate lyase